MLRGKLFILVAYMASAPHWLIERLLGLEDQIVLVVNNKEYSGAELAHQATIYLDDITRNLESESVVLLQSDYSFLSIAFFLALLSAGHVAVPTISKLEKEVEERAQEAYADYIVRDLTPKTYSVITLPEKKGQHELISDIFTRGHAGLILFSSGSEGKPKAMIQDLTALAETFRSKRPKSIAMVVFLMFDHIGGINTLLNALCMGSKMVIPAKREPEDVAALIQAHKVRILPASPTFLNLMLMAAVQEKYDLSSLRLITYGTETMPESLLRRLKEIFPKVKLLQTFGTSETGIANVRSQSSSSLFMQIEDPNCEYKVVDGELWLRSKTQIAGYLNTESDRFKEGGWFNTGDMVEQNDEGYFRIVGRTKEVINVGGEKVLPAEVENLLLHMPEIRDCLVFGRPNAITGQTVCAQITTNSDISRRDLRKQIRTFFADKTAPYKVPTQVEIVDTVHFSDRFKKMRINQ